MGEAKLGSTMPLDKALHWESLCLSHPAAVSKKQASGSLIHSFGGCRHFRKILLFYDFADKAVPGAQHLPSALIRTHTGHRTHVSVMLWTILSSSPPRIFLSF